MMNYKFCRKNCKELLLYVLFAIVLLFVLLRKQNYMEDELLTYNLANGRGWLAPVDGEIYSPADKPFIEYMAADGHLNIQRVWVRQEQDVHPPFYYLLVHIICCVFPYSISVRYAGLINILFQLCTLYVIRKLIDCFTSDIRIKTIISIAYIVCPGVLNISALLRMYVMLGFWITCVTYLHIRCIKGYSARYFGLLCIITVLGALTHYHFILYTILISMVDCVYILKDKRFKDVIGYVMTMSLSGIIAYYSFPAMIDHVFVGYRGTGSIENLKHADFFQRVSDFFNIVNKDVFGGFATLFFCAFVFNFFLDYMSNEKMDELFENTYEKRQYIYIALPIALYFLFVSKSVPVSEDRYIYSIYPLIIVVIPLLFYKILNRYLINKKNVYNTFVIIIVLYTVSALLQSGWHYLYLESRSNVLFAEKEGKESDIICLYSGSWSILPSYMEIVKFNNSLFYEISSEEEIEQKENDIMNNVFARDRLCLMCTRLGEYEEEYIKKMVVDNGYEIYDSGAFGYSTSYYLKKVRDND